LPGPFRYVTISGHFSPVRQSESFNRFTKATCSGFLGHITGLSDCAFL
jgi:hypothetical protein